MAVAAQGHGECQSDSGNAAREQQKRPARCRAAQDVGVQRYQHPDTEAFELPE